MKPPSAPARARLGRDFRVRAFFFNPTDEPILKEAFKVCISITTYFHFLSYMQLTALLLLLFCLLIEIVLILFEIKILFWLNSY